MFSAGAVVATRDIAGMNKVAAVNILAAVPELNVGETSDPFNGVSIGCRYDNTIGATAYGACVAFCCRIAP